MTQVLCEECDNIIELPKLRRKVLKGLAYEFYWHCPECNYKYVSYYTDQKIRRDIKRQERRWERYRKQLDIYDNLLIQVDSWNKDKDDFLSDEEMEVANKLEQSQSEARRIKAQINMNDKLIKKDMDALKERMQKGLVK